MRNCIPISEQDTWLQALYCPFRGWYVDIVGSRKMNYYELAETKGRNRLLAVLT